jgi:hypothetical protein
MQESQSHISETMKIVALTPHQIITLNDYPIYSEGMLREYFRKCMTGASLPFVPVIGKTIVRQSFSTELSQKLEQFERANPLAGYFMLDGSHRTTALTLAGRKIVAIIYEKDGDIQAAQALVVTGQILENATLEYTVAENCAILHTHFQAHPYFMTVHQKTVKLLQENYIAHYGLSGLIIEEQE